jgi:hypothetical protein
MAVGLLSLYGCASYPAAKEQQTECNVITSELEIDTNEDLLKILNGPVQCKGEACLALLAPILVVSAGSFIISGSIVVAGNTVHWLEVKTRCPKEGWIFESASNLE